MTREEMIEQLENTILLIRQNGKDWWDERDIPILEEAIKAMKTEPCEDCISRQAAIYAINHAQINFNVESEIDFTNHKREVHEIVAGVLDAQEKALKDLPSVQPEPKTGKWIPIGIVDANDNRDYECSECHHGDTHAKNQIVPYCWFCGTKMEESEDKCKNCEYYRNPDYTRCHECKAGSEDKE